jgi:hypothetical protein
MTNLTLIAATILVPLASVAQAETITIDRSISDGDKVETSTNVRDSDGNTRVARTKDASCFQQWTVLKLDLASGAFDLFVRGNEQINRSTFDRSHTKDVREDGTVAETWSSYEVKVASKASWTVKVSRPPRGPTAR